MIHILNTPHNAGIAIHGDNLDFDALYRALHTIVGDDGEHLSLDSARMRVLGICYDIRHALMGDREVEFVDNGMTEDKMRRLSTITSSKNVYLKINVLWPEILFVMMALNDFVRVYAHKQARQSYDVMLDNRNIWDAGIAQVRAFQAAVVQCIKDHVSDNSFRRMMNLLNSNYAVLDDYVTQYVDVLNGKFIALDPEKRLKSIPTMTKRLVEQGDEYLQLRSEIMWAAKSYDCLPANIEMQGVACHEDIEW